MTPVRLLRPYIPQDISKFTPVPYRTSAFTFGAAALLTPLRHLITSSRASGTVTMCDPWMTSFLLFSYERFQLAASTEIPSFMTAPAHPQVTGVAMYPALFNLLQTRPDTRLPKQLGRAVLQKPVSIQKSLGRTDRHDKV